MMPPFSFRWLTPLGFYLLLSSSGIIQGQPTSADKGPREPPLTPKDLGHWSFQRPVRPFPPSVQEPKWVKNPVDQFVLARLQKAGLKPSPPAERASLLRRVNFDLIGLPPTSEELADFL